ncbi:MAG: hypothetical protein EXR72_04325 [Myxococcales bacterium]|nr:hypothetical protein [Myxococcales bacterium]
MTHDRTIPHLTGSSGGPTVPDGASSRSPHAPTLRAPALFAALTVAAGAGCGNDAIARLNYKALTQSLRNIPKGTTDALAKFEIKSCSSGNPCRTWEKAISCPLSTRCVEGVGCR